MLAACSGDMMLLLMAFIHARREVCMLSRMFIASVSFSSNQSLCLHWVTPNTSWAAPYRGSLRSAHSVSASGVGSISSLNMMLGFSVSCCWTVADLSYATSSFFRGVALHLYLLGCTLRHI